MTLRTDRAVKSERRRAAGAASVLAAAVMLGSALAGCGVVGAVNKVAHDVSSNRAIIDQFTTKMKAGEATPFAATYVTTGSSPTTIQYAVRPPDDLAFKDSTTGGTTGATSADLVVNSSGAYSCTPPSGGGQWTCEKFGKANAAEKNSILSFYTPSHWVEFLRGFSLAAGFAGDKVSTSTRTVNGFSMNCVDFRAAGIPGTSTICTTAQGILGYVKVASESTSFQLKSFTSAPADSLFELPPGAKITTPQQGDS